MILCSLYRLRQKSLSSSSALFHFIPPGLHISLSAGTSFRSQLKHPFLCKAFLWCSLALFGSPCPVLPGHSAFPIITPILFYYSYLFSPVSFRLQKDRNHVYLVQHCIPSIWPMPWDTWGAEWIIPHGTSTMKPFLTTFQKSLVALRTLLIWHVSCFIFCYVSIKKDVYTYWFSVCLWKAGYLIHWWDLWSEFHKLST